MRYTELYEERASIDGVPVTLIRNPQPNMLMFFIEGTRQGLARGIIVDQDVVYWDACKATHADIQQYLGVTVTEDGFDVAEIRPDYYRVTCRPQFKQQVLANANVVRSLNDPAMHFINEDGTEIALTA